MKRVTNSIEAVCRWPCYVMCKWSLMAPVVGVKVNDARLVSAKWRADKTTWKPLLLELVNWYFKGALIRKMWMHFAVMLQALRRCSESTVMILFCVHDQGWTWACEQNSNWARPPKSPQPLKRLQRVVQQIFYNCVHWSHALSTAVTLSHHDYTTLTHRVMFPECSFWNSAGIVTTANGSTAGRTSYSGNLHLLMCSGELVELTLWTASRALVPSFTKLRHCQACNKPSVVC